MLTKSKFEPNGDEQFFLKYLKNSDVFLLKITGAIAQAYGKLHKLMLNGKHNEALSSYTQSAPQLHYF